MPWVRLLADPSLVCPYPCHMVDHHALQRLNPNTELTCDILGSYIALCRAENKDEAVKFLMTYFWPQVFNPHEKNYNGATRMLFTELVGPFFSNSSFLPSINLTGLSRPAKNSNLDAMMPPRPPSTRH